jgi:NmrA-like family
MDLKLALNAQILATGTETANEAMAHNALDSDPSPSPKPAYRVDAIAKKKSVANSTTTEWNVGRVNTGDDGNDNDTGGGVNLSDVWPSHLPRPPSRKNLMTDDDSTISASGKVIPRVVVFNANTNEGASMVRVLSEKGLRVNAVVRIVTNRNIKKLAKLRGVTIKVADLNDRNAVKAAAKNCQSAFLVTKYWERFETSIEEQMAQVVLEASAQAGITRLVLATFEDTAELRKQKRHSQLQPTPDGRIFPKFDGMDHIDNVGCGLGVQVTHMMTSYFDQDNIKRSLILIRGTDGRIITQSQIVK